MKKRLSVPLLLGSALLVYALIGEPPQIIQDPIPAQTALRVPDSYARTVRVEDFDSEGVLLDRSDAVELRRFKTEALVEMDTLRSWHFGEEGPWIADANTGLLRENSERLDLSGDVRLRYAVEGVEFRSESMILNLRDRTARSTAPVRAWQGPNETYAEQLFVNLDRQMATLSGSVVTVYEPQN